MPKPPKCKLCGHVHWFSEPHVLANSFSARAEYASAVKREYGVTPKVTNVTDRVTSVTTNGRRVTNVTYVPTEAEMMASAVTPEHECPICGRLHKAPTASAKKQAAYRERRK